MAATEIREVMRNSFLPFLLLATLFVACQRPASVELYQKSARAVGGVYSFELELDDSTAAYDFWFYSRTIEQTIGSLQLNVQWLAPSGKRFSEVVYMREVGRNGSRELYRSGVIPAEYGKWKLSVRPVSDMDDELCGLGLIYSHGT